jgi:transcriptional regulator with XRE-family HTH domain
MTSWKLERVHKQLESEGRTRTWLARYCGISEYSLSHYLTGRRTPKMPIVKLAAQALNVSEEYLLGTSDDPLPSDGLITRKVIGG